MTTYVGHSLRQVGLPPKSGLELIGEYIQAVAYRRLHGEPLYRGHASIDWKVKASALRDEAAGLTTRSQLRQWKAVAQRFVSPRPTTNLEYLILAQHYGIPTCLLDWTTNPLVALYFACQPEAGKDTGVVVQVPKASFRQIDAIDTKVAIFKADRDEPLLLDTSASNVRSTAQDSFMSLHTPNEPDIKALDVWIIHPAQKLLILQALETFGITTARVYADLGLAAEQFRSNLAGEKDFYEMAADLGVKPYEEPYDPEDDLGL